jgi:hypothetical protein
MDNNHANSPSSNLHKEQSEDKKTDTLKALYSTLYKKPLSRRMAATEIGFPDQTYMVTQAVNDWIKQGKAQVIGAIKCSRSGRLVEAITTNPKLFRPTDDNQLRLFERSETTPV